MRDRTAFGVLGAVLIAAMGVGGFVMRPPKQAAAAPASLFPPPPASASASVTPPMLVIRPAPHAPATKGKTLERAAADAFHAGDRRRAAALYSELAGRTPENPAFAAAAALLQGP